MNHIDTSMSSPSHMDAIELSLFAARIEAVCDEMGAVLQKAAFSPNIKDRLDFSCAIFDARGELCAQAAHIPVHLGSMAYAMAGIVTERDWHAGDMVIVNDPFLGGTHLPDVTLIAPLFHDDQLMAFVVNRAHHADIGASSPGSMPISKSLEEEGLVIPPTLLIQNGEVLAEVMASLTDNTRNPVESGGDIAAQISANRVGLERLSERVQDLGNDGFEQALLALNDYGERLARSALQDIPDGDYRFGDVMDDDGQGHTAIPIQAQVQVQQGQIHVDFSGTAAQVPGNINCPLSVAAAAVYYVFRCLMPAHTPACAGVFRPITLHADEGLLVNAQRPAAVAAGNVETSTRIVDVIMGALAQAISEHMAAASHGSMNNLAMGSADPEQPWDYYETMGGGMGASVAGPGASALQTHMTNTLNTPVEAMEMRFPVRVEAYAIRRGSGGEGLHKGGDGLIRRFRFLKAAHATLLTERRMNQPWGMNAGGNGQAGENRLNGECLGPKVETRLEAGDVLEICTPGGGAYGRAESS